LPGSEVFVRSAGGETDRRVAAKLSCSLPGASAENTLILRRRKDLSAPQRRATFIIGQVIVATRSPDEQELVGSFANG
jgi:hypothetical protein